MQRIETGKSATDHDRIQARRLAAGPAFSHHVSRARASRIIEPHLAEGKVAPEIMAGISMAPGTSAFFAWQSEEQMTVSSAGAAAFPRKPLPKRFCNLDRLLHALKARGLDGIVATVPNNVFYLTGFNAIAHKSDEPRVCAVVLSRHAPDHPIMVVADYYLATFLTQETWVEDIRPFRAVMMPLDLPAGPPTSIVSFHCRREANHGSRTRASGTHST